MLPKIEEHAKEIHNLTYFKDEAVQHVLEFNLDEMAMKRLCRRHTGISGEPRHTICPRCRYFGSS